jgi:putative transposase
LEEVTTTSEACALLGIPRASVYRRRAPASPTPTSTSTAPARRGGSQPTALSQAERDEIRDALNSPRFVDKSPEQVWATLLDEGVYLGSVASLYRVLREGGPVTDRRAQARHPTRTRPELLALGPDQIWSWDTTALKGPVRGVNFDAFVMLDIYSRKSINWEVHTTENGELAEAFIANSVRRNDGVLPNAVHNDNGSPMISKPVAALLDDLTVRQSFSRPGKSNDNPYSEAAFKTLKYCPVFPDRFGSIQDARVFLDAFFTYYNTEHRHSGIGYYTPASVHDGSWKHIRDARQKTLDAAYETHPERFRRGRPQAPGLPIQVWINKPHRTIESN